MGNASKQFRSWVDDFHVFMLNHKYLEKHAFVKLTLINCDEAVAQFNDSDKNHLMDYVKMYYKFVNQ